MILVGSYLCAAVAVCTSELHVDQDPRCVLWSEAISDALFFSLLVGVSYLWRPSDRAREYSAYHSAQQLPPPADERDDDVGYELARSRSSPLPEEHGATRLHNEYRVVDGSESFNAHGAEEQEVPRIL